MDGNKKRVTNALISFGVSLMVIFIFTLAIAGPRYFSELIIQAYKAIILTGIVAFTIGIFVKNKSLIFPVTIGSLVGLVSGSFFVYFTMFNI